MKLYHGSNVAIQEPDLEYSKPLKDFGRGFYLSDTKEQARIQAERRTAMEGTGCPIISCFEFDDSVMNSTELKIKTFENYSEEWALFVLRNRSDNFPQPAHCYDIVYGPIADDGVTFQLRRYERGAISLHDLVLELQFAKGITFQYFFGTKPALKKIKYYGTEY
jgi:hypothetical protein